jgi:membrane-bound lytic murein transglycosylase D
MNYLRSASLTLILLQTSPVFAESGLETGRGLSGADAGTSLGIISQEVIAVNRPDSGIWDRVRKGFSLPEYESKDIADYEDWYSARPDYIARMFNRARRYLYFILGEVERRNMPTEIALLPAIESAFKPDAHSSSGASGLWQFIPGTADMFGLRQDAAYDGRLDVVRATHAALDYLEELYQHFDGDWHLALAAYNGGKGYITRAIQWNVDHDLPTGLADLDLRSETRRFVPKLLAVRNIVREPAMWGLKLPGIPDQEYFADIYAPPGMHLDQVALQTGASTAELRALNPALQQLSVPIEGPFNILVPTGLAGFMENNTRTITANIPEKPVARSPSGWRFAAEAREGITRVYRVQPGDTLWSISRLFSVPVARLREWNNIASPQQLSPGQSVRINLN